MGTSPRHGRRARRFPWCPAVRLRAVLAVCVLVSVVGGFAALVRPGDVTRPKLRTASGACGPDLCMLVVVPPGNPMFHSFDDVLSSVSDAVRALGGTATVKLVDPGVQWTRVCAQGGTPACHHVVLGANILAMPAYKDTPPPPPGFAIYNLEQVGDTAWFGAGSLALLRSHAVWEYSTRNAVKLAELGVATTPVPVGFGQRMVATATPPTDGGKDIDVLLIGTCHARRCHVLQQLNARGYVARLAGGECPPPLDACNAIRLPVAFGADRDALLARARVVLNVHYFEAGVFEVARVSYLLANRHFVVSERGNDPGLEATYEGGLVFAESYDALADTVAQHLAAGDAERAAVAERGFQIVSRERLESFVRCPVFGQETRRHVRVEFEGEPAWTVSPSRVHPNAPRSGANRRPSCASLRRGHADLVADAGEPVTPLVAFAGDPRLHPPPAFRVVAVLAGYNEADVIPSSVRDYLRQGVSVHYIDNWSTDGTMEVLARLQAELEVWRASGGVSPGWLGRLDDATSCAGVPAPDVTLTFEVYPKQRPRFYDWRALLGHKVQVAQRMQDATWVIHSDPDEIRESPWGPAVPLRQALYVADVMGYNFVNFARFQKFVPVTPGPKFDASTDDLRTFFEYRDDDGINVDRTVQVKAWRRLPGQPTARGAQLHVNLTAMGGHFAFYQTSNPGGAGAWNAVFPWLFTLRHYPVRGAAHGVRKVLKERFGRWNPEERKKGWHTQYDEKIMRVLGIRCADDAPVCMLPLGLQFTPEQEQAIAAELQFVKPKAEATRGPGGDLPSSFYEQELPCPPDPRVTAALAASGAQLPGDEVDEWLRRDGPLPCGVLCRARRYVKGVDDEWVVFKRAAVYMYGAARER